MSHGVVELHRQLLHDPRAQGHPTKQVQVVFGVAGVRGARVVVQTAGQRFRVQLSVRGRVPTTPAIGACNIILLMHIHNSSDRISSKGIFML